MQDTHHVLSLFYSAYLGYKQKNAHIFILTETCIYLVLIIVIRFAQLGRIMHNQHSSSYQPAKQKASCLYFASSTNLNSRFGASAEHLVP